MTDDSQAAWDFVVDVYARPGVAEACLYLQDNACVDVVEMLMLIYSDLVLGKSLSAAQIIEMREKMRGWRETAILPLRAIRRALKPLRTDGADHAKNQLRNEVKKAELMAERLQIDLTVNWFRKCRPESGLSLDMMLETLIPAGKREAKALAALKQVTNAAKTVRAERQP